MDDIRLVWFMEKNSYVWYPCIAPFGRENIIKEGIRYEFWMTLLKEKIRREEING